MSKPSETPSEERSGNPSASDRLHPHTPQEFSPEQRLVLLSIAHEAILSALDLPVPDLAPPLPGLSQPRGVFTTLYLDGQLRGCVGYAAPVAPLYRAVAETARAAAFDDSRFVAVTAKDARRLEISLSVLSLPFRIASEAVEVGVHGLLIEQGNRRGLLLPQVSIEHGWNRETLLEQTCRKAGLPLDAWRKGATLEAFTAEVFSDAPTLT